MINNSTSNFYFIETYHADFLDASRSDNFMVDLTVTSPPYNVDISYDVYNDKQEYGEYLDFSRNYLSKILDITNSTGRLCLNIPIDKNKGGQQSVLADITTIAKEVGWKYHSTILWNEGNISKKTAWGSWLSASAPYVIAPVEAIVVLYKDEWKRRHKGKSTINRDEFIQWTTGLWTFSGEKKRKSGHPAAFPRELPRRCIKLFSFEGDTILDPFMGSGTTLIEACDQNRRAIGFDISEKYYHLAQKRISMWKASKTKLF